MLINEVSKQTSLTKKAIEYYTEQGLVAPSILENGYRDYDSRSIEKLKRISILRKLDVSTEDIGTILDDTSNSALQVIAVKKELGYQRDLCKKKIIDKLSTGTSYEEIYEEMQAIEQSKTITDKILDAFPGYYGRLFCMHFARFLNEPLKTEEQKVAYQTVLDFLDNVPDMNIPEELMDYLEEVTRNMGTDKITKMLNATQKSYQDPEKFLNDNKEFLKQYLKLKKSEEYQQSPAVRLSAYLKEFNRSNGYNDIFLPAMKQLSPQYAEYSKQIEYANDKLLEQFPEFAVEEEN